MRQRCLAGEKLFIDYGGKTVVLADGSTGRVFVSALGASSYTFACATGAQRQGDWFNGTTSALAFYGGVPELIVPDSARALIVTPNRYEPRANGTVRDFARHYATSVLPARPYSPRDKAAVESAVQMVSRWILARLRHRRFDNVYALGRAFAGAQRAALPEAARESRGPVPRDRPPGAAALTGGALRVEHLQDGGFGGKPAITTRGRIASRRLGPRSLPSGAGELIHMLGAERTAHGRKGTPTPERGLDLSAAKFEAAPSDEMLVPLMDSCPEPHEDRGFPQACF